MMIPTMPPTPIIQASWREALAWRPPCDPGAQKPDPHLLAAVLLALPAWLGMGLWAAAALRAPVGLWAWISLTLLMPLLEELVFRGLLQGQLLRVTALHSQPRRIGPITWANGLCTLAFVALHLPTQPLPWALAVAVPSLVFGHLRERFDSVWPAVGVHALYNTGFAFTAWLTKV